MITKKKLAATIAAGALLISGFIPAAFANNNHGDHSNHTNNNSNDNENHKSWGSHSHKLFTTLKGENEVPGPGDPDGFGVTRVKVNHEDGQVCVRIRVHGIAPATAAHIHEGDPGTKGPVVVDLPKPDENGRATGCVSISTDLAEKLADHPSDYYVNVHNADYPDGAIRGQL